MVADNLKWRLEEAARGAAAKTAALEKALEEERAMRFDAEQRASRLPSPPQKMMVDMEPQPEPPEVHRIRRSIVEGEVTRLVAEHHQRLCPSTSQYTAMEVELMGAERETRPHTPLPQRAGPRMRAQSEKEKKEQEEVKGKRPKPSAPHPPAEKEWPGVEADPWRPITMDMIPDLIRRIAKEVVEMLNPPPVQFPPPPSAHG